MIVSADALGLEEDLSGVEASVTDLITVEEAGDMAGSSRTWDFGPVLVTEDMIEELWKLGCFGEAKVKPPQGETIPKPQPLMPWSSRTFPLQPLLPSSVLPSPSP